jgi:RsiW-degrading membrane proteinase PrsW (M82 family)
VLIWALLGGSSFALMMHYLFNSSFVSFSSMCKLIIRLVLALLVILAFIPYKCVLALSENSSSFQSSASDLIAEVNSLRAANGLPA